MSERALPDELAPVLRELPELWAAGAGLLPASAPAPALRAADLLDGAALTPKGRKVLGHLRAVADLLDLPLA